MSSHPRLQFMRFLEQFMLFFLLLWVGGMSYFYASDVLATRELLAGGGIFALAFAVRVYIRHTIDTRINVLLSQTNYAHDEAFAALFERSPVAYLIINNKGIILESNQAAIKLLEAERDTITNTNFFGCLQDSEGREVSVLRGKVRAGVTLTDTETALQTVAGKTIWVLLSTFAYRSAGQRLVTLVDVTEQKQIDTAKSEFVALATHQLRTPIAAIRWNVELLQKSLTNTITDAQGRYLAKIERNVMRMIALINDFLSVSKLEMGTYAASEEVIELREYLSGILDEYAGKIEEKQIVVQRQSLPESLTIKADSRLFHIIVSNLVSNAVKYSDPQGTLELSYQLQGDRLILIVADNGIGVPKAELEKLFTKFYRASNAQSHQTEGTGLGLYIVQQSVEQLGGRITVSSDEGQGARFEVEIPVKVVS